MSSINIVEQFTENFFKDCNLKSKKFQTSDLE